MANEWVKIELEGANNDGGVRRYTIADGTSISKGTLLALSDPRTVTASTWNSIRFGGVASEEHLANVGVTTISAWTNGIFTANASGALVAGEAICGMNNQVTASGAGTTLGSTAGKGAGILGYALEDAADGEDLTVRLSL